MKFLSHTRTEIGFLAIVALYVLVSWLTAFVFNLTAYFHPVMYLDTGIVITTTLLIGFVFYLGARCYWIMIFRRPPELARYLWEDLKRGALKPERYVRALPIFLGTIFFLSAFTSMKQMISAIQPFSWDQPLAAIDKLIHFGVDPWRILQPMLGFPFVTWGINIVYNLWIVGLFLALYWQLFSLKNLQIRMQFFYAFCLSWAINGTFLAIVFSSAGPCYFERLVGSAYFEPLMGYLREASTKFFIMAIPTQDKLWEAVKNKETIIGGGISSMPSIHVTTTFLFLLTALKLKTRLWLAFAVFHVLILLGSVHLAWHYAIDDYFAMLTTFAIWQFSGWLVERLGQRQDLPLLAPAPD